MNQIAAKCDASGCRGGYIGQQICWKCEGNGRILISEAEAKRKISRSARIIGCIIFVVVCAVGAWLIGHGGR
jgi:hypothetical protein